MKYENAPIELPPPDCGNDEGEEMFYCGDNTAMPKSWVVDQLKDGETLESLEVYNCYRNEFRVEFDTLMFDHCGGSSEHVDDYWYLKALELVYEIESLIPPTYVQLKSRPPVEYFLVEIDPERYGDIAL